VSGQMICAAAEKARQSIHRTNPLENVVQMQTEIWY
jgi:hypothetical protein